MIGDTVQRRSGIEAGAVIVAIVTLVVAALIFIAIERTEPDFIAELTVMNPTDAQLHVAVKSSPEGGVQLLGTFEPGSTRSLGSVIDQGAEWIFVVGWRDVVGEFVVSREQLEADDWTVELPHEIADEVHERYPPIDIEGATPSG